MYQCQVEKTRHLWPKGETRATRDQRTRLLVARRERIRVEAPQEAAAAAQRLQLGGAQHAALHHVDDARQGARRMLPRGEVAARRRGVRTVGPRRGSADRGRERASHRDASPDRRDPRLFHARVSGSGWLWLL
jgi:hypothetical protein